MTEEEDLALEVSEEFDPENASELLEEIRLDFVQFRMEHGYPY